MEKIPYEMKVIKLCDGKYLEVFLYCFVLDNDELCYLIHYYLVPYFTNQNRPRHRIMHVAITGSPLSTAVRHDTCRLHAKHLHKVR